MGTAFSGHRLPGMPRWPGPPPDILLLSLQPGGHHGRGGATLMEGRGPYRIYDPGGGAPPGEASAAFERLVEENSRLKEKMQGIKMLGKTDPALSLHASSLLPAMPAGICLHPSCPSVPPSPALAPVPRLCLCTLWWHDGSIPSPDSPAPQIHDDGTQNT